MNMFSVLDDSDDEPVVKAPVKEKKPASSAPAPKKETPKPAAKPETKKGKIDMKKCPPHL